MAKFKSVWGYAAAQMNKKMKKVKRTRAGRLPFKATFVGRNGKTFKKRFKTLSAKYRALKAWTASGGRVSNRWA